MSVIVRSRKHLYLGISWAIFGTVVLADSIIRVLQALPKLSYTNFLYFTFGLATATAGIGMLRKGRTWARGLIITVSALTLTTSLFGAVALPIMVLFKTAPVTSSFVFSLLLLPLSLYTLILYIRSNEAKGDEGEIPIWNRNKATAILLALFFGPWTWLYTYRKDPGKAAFGLGITISTITIFISVFLGFKRSQPQPNSLAGEGVAYLALGLMQIIFAVWLFAVISACASKEYSIYKPETRSKLTAIPIAVFLGPWTWFYTYKKDYRKFWLTVLVGLGELAAATLLSGRSNIAYGLFSVSIIIMWIIAIIVAMSRESQWYTNY